MIKLKIGSLINSTYFKLILFLVILFFPNLSFTQILSRIPKKTKVPHKYISRIHFLNGTFEDYELLKVLEEQVEVVEYSKENKLKAPFKRSNFSTPTLKLHYLDINRIVISRKNAFSRGFLRGGIVGGVTGIVLGSLVAGIPEIDGGEIITGLGALGFFSVGLVGGLISLGTKKRRFIRGDKDRFERLKPYIIPFQHFK